jgi:hypothetical protein
MEPLFPDMRIGKIRISHPGGEAIGELIPYHFPQDRLFGARIDILGPAIHGSRAEPIPLGRFVTARHFTVTILKLPKEALEKIQRTDGNDVPYSLAVE